MIVRPAVALIFRIELAAPRQPASAVIAGALSIASPAKPTPQDDQVVLLESDIVELHKQDFAVVDASSAESAER